MIIYTSLEGHTTPEPAHTCTSSIFTFFSVYSFLSICPISALNVPRISFLLYFGTDSISILNAQEINFVPLLLFLPYLKTSVVFSKSVGLKLFPFPWYIRDSSCLSGQSKSGLQAQLGHNTKPAPKDAGFDSVQAMCIDYPAIPLNFFLFISTPVLRARLSFGNFRVQYSFSHCIILFRLTRIYSLLIIRLRWHSIPSLLIPQASKGIVLCQIQLAKDECGKLVCFCD